VWVEILEHEKYRENHVEKRPESYPQNVDNVEKYGNKCLYVKKIEK